MRACAHTHYILVSYISFISIVFGTRLFGHLLYMVFHEIDTHARYSSTLSYTDNHLEKPKKPKPIRQFRWICVWCVVCVCHLLQCNMDIVLGVLVFVIRCWMKFWLPFGSNFILANQLIIGLCECFRSFSAIACFCQWLE